MSVKSEIDRIAGNIAKTYAAAAEKGAAMPEVQDSAALAETVASIPVCSKPNLLSNWYFPDPINQRGQKEYTAMGYTIDRWVEKYANGTKQLTDTGILLQEGTSTQGLLQYLEDFKQFSCKTMTFSLLVPMLSGTLRVHIAYRDSSGAYRSIETANLDSPGLLQSTATLPDLNDAQEFFVRFYTVDSTTSAIVSAAKLELGTRQTLARQDEDGSWVLNDPPPDKALELAKCQRYYYKMAEKRNNNIMWCAFDNETTGYGIIYTPVPMRVKPAIMFNGMLKVSDVNDMSVSKMSCGNMKEGTNIITVSVNGSGFPTGTVGRIELMSDGSVELSADL